MSTLPIINPCQGCGSCCRNQPYPPYLWLDGDVPPEPHHSTLLAMIMSDARDDNQPCLWLTTDGRCEHYDIRPMICRDFEPGEEDCNEMRAALGLSLLPSVPDEDD